MTTKPLIGRRAALAAGLAGTGAVALAACSSSSGSTASTPPTTSPAPAGSDTSTTTSESSSSSSSGSAGGEQVAKLADIKVGEAIAAKLGGKDVLVSRPTATTAACFSAICTHMGCTVKPAGTTLACPCHGSVYDAKTGAVVKGPAPAPLHKIAVTVSNGEVVTG